jgi:hypothetical protein
MTDSMTSMHPQIRERLNLAHAMGSTDFTDSTDGTALDRCLKRERAGRKSWRLKPAFGIKFGSGDVTHLPALRALRRGARLSPWRDEGLTPRRKGATCSRPASTPLPPHPPLDNSRPALPLDPTHEHRHRLPNLVPYFQWLPHPFHPSPPPASRTHFQKSASHPPPSAV